MKTLLTITFRSILLVFHIIVWAPLGLAAALIPSRGRTFTLASQKWGRQVIRLAGVKPEIKGVEHLDPNSTYVVCANHQSLLDIPLLFAGVPVPLRFLAKRSLFFIPIFGWALYFAGFIPVDRGNTAKARKSIDDGAKRIKRGPSLIVFPEGTRTGDGSIHSFKSGAFILAIRSSVPVVPVAIKGTYDVIPKSSLGVKPAPVTLMLGTPIPTEGMTQKDKDVLLKKTWGAVVEMLETGEPV